LEIENEIEGEKERKRTLLLLILPLLLLSSLPFPPFLPLFSLSLSSSLLSFFFFPVF
jgi:hypothetical protein